MPNDNGPQTELEARADHALRVFESEVQVLGGEVEQAVLLAHAAGLGDANGVVASHGDMSPHELFEFLLHATLGIGEALGYSIGLVDPGASQN